MNEPLGFVDWMWELTREDHEECARHAGERLADEFIADMYAVEDDAPGLGQVKGRELLAFFESQPAQYWADLLAEHPDDAKAEFKEWMRLDRRYNPELQDVPLMTDLLA